MAPDPPSHEITSRALIRVASFALAVLAGYGWLRRRGNNRSRSIARQMVREEVLQRYLDRMSGYLQDPIFHDQPAGGNLQNLARAHTLTTLARLDPAQKGVALRFLYEAALIGGEPDTVHAPVIVLQHADLREARLAHANLGWANLVAANLSEADLSGAFLSGANLGGADLINTDLSGAVLAGANLFLADLRGCNFQDADLTGALVSEAQLQQAKNVDDAVV